MRPSVSNNSNRQEKITDKVFEIDWARYKLKRIIEDNEYNIHHILSRQLKNEYNTEIPQNKMRIKVRRHIWLNQLFWDKQTPHQQLDAMVQIRYPVLSNQVKLKLLEVLNTPLKEFYIEDLYKERWMKTKKKKR